jgi:hypothetical protein
MACRARKKPAGAPERPCAIPTCLDEETPNQGASFERGAVVRKLANDGADSCGPSLADPAHRTSAGPAREVLSSEFPDVHRDMSFSIHDWRGNVAQSGGNRFAKGQLGHAPPPSKFLPSMPPYGRSAPHLSSCGVATCGRTYPRREPRPGTDGTGYSGSRIHGRDYHWSRRFIGNVARAAFLRRPPAISTLWTA